MPGQTKAGGLCLGVFPPILQTPWAKASQVWALDSSGEMGTVCFWLCKLNVRHAGFLLGWVMDTWCLSLVGATSLPVQSHPGLKGWARVPVLAPELGFYPGILVHGARVLTSGSEDPWCLRLLSQLLDLGSRDKVLEVPAWAAESESTSPVWGEGASPCHRKPFGLEEAFKGYLVQAPCCE